MLNRTLDETDGKLVRQLQLRAGDLEPELAARFELPASTPEAERARAYARVLYRDGLRYYVLLRASLEAVHLTEAQATLLVHLLAEVAEAWWETPTTVSLLWAKVADQARAKPWLVGQWGADEAALDKLVATLRDLPAFACMAVVDAVERFWRGPDKLEGPSWAERLELVGLYRPLVPSALRTRRPRAIAPSKPRPRQPAKRPRTKATASPASPKE